MAESFEQQKARYLAEMEALRAARRSPEPQPPASIEPPASGAPPTQPPIIPPAPPAAANPPQVSDKSQRGPQPDGSPANTASPSNEREEGSQPRQPLQDKEQEDAGFGTLIVQVVTADGTLPVAGARVVVSRLIDGERTLQGYDVTDISGRTGEFTLPAPPASLSQTPGNPHPYASYIITVQAVGFGTAEFRNVPIFTGIRSIQRVVLLPVPEFGSPAQDPSSVTETQTLDPENQPAEYLKEGESN